MIVLFLRGHNHLSFYRKISGTDFTYMSQICPCLKLSVPDSPFYTIEYNVSFLKRAILFQMLPR